MPINKTLNPFDLTFDISENAEANAVLKIEILEDAVLSGDDSYTFDTITNNEITTNPILIQAMSIIGADEIDGLQHTLFCLPRKMRQTKPLNGR